MAVTLHFKLWAENNVSFKRVFPVLLFASPSRFYSWQININPLNTELNPISHLLALLGAHRILHVSRVRVNYHTVRRATIVAVEKH